MPRCLAEPLPSLTPGRSPTLARRRHGHHRCQWDCFRYHVASIHLLGALPKKDSFLTSLLACACVIAQSYLLRVRDARLRWLQLGHCLAQHSPLLSHLRPHHHRGRCWEACHWVFAPQCCWYCWIYVRRLAPPQLIQATHGASGSTRSLMCGNAHHQAVHVQRLRHRLTHDLARMIRTQPESRHWQDSGQQPQTAGLPPFDPSPASACSVSRPCCRDSPWVVHAPTAPLCLRVVLQDTTQSMDLLL